MTSVLPPARRTRPPNRRELILAAATGAVYLLCIPESDYVSAQMLICGGGFFG